MRKILQRSHERGSAMFVAILLVTVGILTLLAVSEMAGENFKRTDSFLTREQSFYAATGGTEFVVSELWGQFISKRGTQTDKDFRAYLESEKAFSGGQKLLKDTTIEPTDFNGRRLGNAEISRVRLTRYDYNDPTGGTELFSDILVEVEATTDLGQSAWASRVLGTRSKVPFAGLDYAVLTKNITCSLCHMRVQSLSKQLNTNKGYYGQFGKVRVGTTELLAMRTGSAETLIEGALYHRGRIEQEDSGNAINYSDVTGSTVRTVQQDIEKGSVKQDATTGAVLVTQLSSTGVIDTASYRSTNGLDDDGDQVVDEGDESSATRNRDGIDSDGNGLVDDADEVVMFDPKNNRRINQLTGVPNKNDSLYLEYPKIDSQMKASDGELPVDKIMNKFDPSQDQKAFPEPFKDTNKNRKIDTAEINLQVATAVNRNNQTSTLDVPIAMKLAPGEVYGGGTMPDSASSTVKVGANNSAAYSTYTNRTSSGVSLTGSSMNDGNYILKGTSANPIRIDGKVVINGDVIIQGDVVGEGQIYATGNVYIPNDIKYQNRIDGATGKEVFGESANPDGAGGYKRNLLGITSGGTIVVGDYLSTVTHWNSGNNNFYDYGVPEAGQKLDRTKMPSLPDTGSLSHMGGNSTSVNTVNTNAANFVMEELAFFNQSELAKVTKSSKVGSDTNIYTAWTQDNRYNPTSNPAGMWRVPEADPTATATTSYVPRFYRMYGEIPNPADAAPTLDYGRSYNSTTYQPVTQGELANSSIPFYINRSSTWQTSKGYYNNTGDPHTYNSISEMKLNLVAGKYVYDQNFFDGGGSGDPLNKTVGKTSATVGGPDNRIPKEVLDTKAIENGSLLNIHPSWITPTNMLNLLLSEEKNRGSLADPSGKGTPRQIDGLLYTNNAIFMIERKKTQTNSGTYDPATGKWSGTWSKVNTKSKGSFVVNGAIIAPDLGILVTGGTQTVSSDKPGFSPTTRNGNMARERAAFTVNYDPRVKDLLYGISDVTKWRTERKGWGRSLGKLP